MKIELKCFADLAKQYGCSYKAGAELEIPDNSTVVDVMRAGGISQEDVKIVFVNGKIKDPFQLLKNGDRVAFAPATGGM